MKITWVTFAAPEPAADGSLTSSVASLRYRVLSPIAGMAQDHVHQIVPVRTGWDQPKLDAALASDVVVFSKSFNTANEEAARRAKTMGAAIVFDVSDDHYQNPELGQHYRNMTALADQVVCATEEMKRVAEPFAKSPPVVIDDPYEGGRRAARFQPGERLELLWFGHPSNLDSLRASLSDLAGYAARRPVSLRIVTTPSAALAALVDDLNSSFGPGLEATAEPWSSESQAAALDTCDAVVIPTLQTERKAVKSANRLVTALWAGRPAVAQPMPGYCAFEAWTPIRDALSQGLAELEANPDAWLEKIVAAQDHIAAANDPTAIARSWDAVLRMARAAAPAKVETADRPAPAPAANAAPVRLNLGCGDKILNGFINVDVVASRAGKKPDVICDLHKLTPFDDDSADEVMAIHVVEHFWRWEVVDVLREWVRVLKPGGKMILECPNLVSACEAVLADPENATVPGVGGQRSMWVLYGDPRWQDPLMVHRWAYTPKSLAQIMFEAGLRELRQESAQYKLREPRDMRITGVKPR